MCGVLTSKPNWSQKKTRCQTIWKYKNDSKKGSNICSFRPAWSTVWHANILKLARDRIGWNGDGRVKKTHFVSQRPQQERYLHGEIKRGQKGEKLGERLPFNEFTFWEGGTNPPPTGWRGLVSRDKGSGLVTSKAVASAAGEKIKAGWKYQWKMKSSQNVDLNWRHLSTAFST